MFNLKKQVNVERVREFCDWFIENNDRIIESMKYLREDNSKVYEMVKEVHLHLYKAYVHGSKKPIDVEYGFNKTLQKWELSIYHLNKKFLYNVSKAIADILNEELKDKWIVTLRK